MRRTTLTLGMMAALLPVAAQAQSGAAWLDRSDRQMALMLPGADESLPSATDRPAADMAGRFKTLCVDTGNDSAQIGAAAQAQAAGLTAVPLTINFPHPRNAPPPVVGIWRGDGMVLSHTMGFFAAPNPQCNLAFYVNTLPARDDVYAALTAALGMPPANADEASRNGRPNLRYAPQWRLPGNRVVLAFVFQGNAHAPGARVHLAIR